VIWQNTIRESDSSDRSLENRPHLWIQSTGS
jgi:hypothetical protein